MAKPPKLSISGASAILLDGARGKFDAGIQRQIWAVAKAARAIKGVQETVPGMNNLMIVFDPLAVPLEKLEAALRELWDRIEPSEVQGRHFEVPVTYGGAHGEDLAGLAHRCGLDLEETVRRHAAAIYTVAAIGAMPGFPYLSGLDPLLAWQRRTNPRLKVQEGSVIIGGGQTGIMPCTAPSGWHILGHSSLKLFDPSADPPALLQPGDTIRFVIAGIDR